MKKSFKVFSLTMALLLALCMLAACTSGSPAPTSASPTGTNQADASATTEVTPAPAEAVTLTIGISCEKREENPPGSGEYPDDNWATRYIAENFAKKNNVDLKFQLIDDTNDSFSQNYLLMMASKKAPDLTYYSAGDYGIVSRMAQDGALYDLQASLDKYGADLTKFLGADFIKQYGQFQGKLYTIPGKEDIPAISHYWIRTDWLKALNLNKPTNFDEWYAVMKAFKERAGELQAAGCVKNAADVIPYAMYHTRYFTDWERIVTRFYDPKYFDPANILYYIYSGYGIEYQKEGFKEGFQFMNQMYKEGLISPNFALDAEQQEFGRAISAGNAGSYCNNLFDGWNPNDANAYHNLLKQNIPGAAFEYVDCFTNKYDNVCRNPLDIAVLTYCIVPYFSQAADQAVMYLNWMTQGENMIVVQYGELGVTYEMDPVLGPVRLGETSELAKKWGHIWGSREHVMVGRLPNRDWSVISSAGAQTKEQAEEAIRLCNEIEKNGYTRFPVELNAVAEKGVYGGGLRTPWEKFCASLIMAKDGEFDKIWNDGVKSLEEAGSAKLSEAYKAYFTAQGYK